MGHSPWQRSRASYPQGASSSIRDSSGRLPGRTTGAPRILRPAWGMNRKEAAMMKSEIEVGQDYGFREKHTDRGQDLLRVTIEESAAKGRWIALWHDGPNKGKRTAIPSGNLAAAWKDAKAFVREERQFLALMESSDKAWSPVEDEPVLDAVDLVLSFTGEFDREPMEGEAWLRGHLRCRQRPFERVCARVGAPSELAQHDPLGFVDRRGWVHVGF